MTSAPTIRRSPTVRILAAALAAVLVPPAHAAPIPHSEARAFLSPATSRQVETLMGQSAAVSPTHVILGAPFDDVGGEDSGVVWVHSAITGALLHRLDNPQAAEQSNFGWSVAVAGNLVAVGVPEDNIGAADSGQVHIYDLSSATPAVPQLSIPNPNPSSNDLFGWSVSLSGTRLVVGTPGGDSGAGNAGCVHVFELSSGTPAVPVLQINNPDPDSLNFGHAVGVDGTRVVASARQGAAGADKGRAYVFDVSSGTPGLPVLTLADDSPSTDEQFGHAVAVSGMKIAVTAPLDDTGAANAGRAFIYDLASGTPELPVVVLANPVAVAEDRFGHSVALSGNRVVVGTPLRDNGSTDTGNASVFDLASPTPAVPVLTVANPTPQNGDEFGHAVALAGSRLVVTAPEDNTGVSDSGSGYLYDLASPTPATPVFTFNNESPGSGGEFGYSVALGGDLVAVGSQKGDAGANNAGSVYLYDLGAPVPEQPWLHVLNPAPSVNDYFGTAVAISGTRLAVSAPQDDAGATNAGVVYVYNTASSTPAVPVLTILNPEPAAQELFGNALALDGDLLVVGCEGNDVAGQIDAGSAYVFDLSSATPAVPAWTIDNPDPAAADGFGNAVAVSGSRVVVGCALDDSGAINAGSARVYDLASGTPTVPLATLVRPMAAADDEFGQAVAISGPHVIVGAPYAEAGATDSGAAYHFDLDSPTPAVPVAELNHDDPEPEDYFGMAVAISGTRVVVGAPEDDVTGTDTGCGYVYELSSATYPAAADRLEMVAGRAGAWMGYAAAADGTNLLLGAPLHDGISESRGAAFLFDPDPPLPELQVEQPPGNPLASGSSSIQFGNAEAGNTGATLTVLLRNVGTAPLEIQQVMLVGGHGTDYSVTHAPLPAVLPVDATLAVDIAFLPAEKGVRSTTLRILSDASVSVFEVTLTGQALSAEDDSDGDGINDVAELRLEALGFDWQVNDEEMIQLLQAGANAVGLYDAGQVEAMHPGAELLAVNPVTGRFTLTLRAEKSVDFAQFAIFPVHAADLSVTPAGSLEYGFTPTGARALFRIAPR
jgi:hypothetical protein